MTGLVRRATLLTAAGLLAAGAAMAGVPTAGNSTLGDPLVNLRAYNGSPSAAAVDQSLPKTIIVRDAANNPVPNSVVVLNFSACHAAGDIRIGSTQPAGFFTNCAAKTISGVTDAAGTVVFRVVGASNTSSGANPGAGELCCTVTADGVALGSLSVGAPDLNGARGGGTDPGMDGTDTLQYTGSRFPGASVPAPPPGGACAPGPGCFTNLNYKPRANFVYGNPVNTGVAFQFIDGQDTLAFALFRFGVGKNPGGGGTGTNGPFCP
jgi:hypothetical protein